VKKRNAFRVASRIEDRLIGRIDRQRAGAVRTRPASERRDERVRGDRKAAPAAATQ
jgi:hypothetical protein